MFSSISEVESFFESRKKLGIKLGLERIQALLTLLGNPEGKIHAIHVAGTNGKGSTIQYISHALLANGYKTGIFTSPSLDGLNGHIYLNNHPITTKQFLQTFHRVYPAIQKLDQDQMEPTEFEILTAIALLFLSEHTDIALIETGMGGREDTTNTILPIMSIITNVQMDHTHFLGRTIQSIASHKAGIIKKNVPVIIGDIGTKALEIIEDEAKRKNAPLHIFQRDYYYQKKDGNQFIWYYPPHLEKKLIIRMHGEHQRKNVSVAMMAIEILRNKGYDIVRERAWEGIQQTIVPGRFEIIHDRPTVILDSAHNPAGIETLIKTLKLFARDRYVHILFAAFKDKNYEKMIMQLKESFSNICLTTFEHTRALEIDELQRLEAKFKINVIENWKNALSFEDNTDIYVITGSFTFIGLVRNYLLMSKK